MKHTQLVNFEMGNYCPYQKQHMHFCPAQFMKPCTENERAGEPVPDAVIIDAMCKLEEDYGFDGLFGFHYYCEPHKHMKRIMKIIENVRVKLNYHPKYLLWTNADEYMKPLTDKDIEFLRAFDQVHITAYTKEYPAVKAVQQIATVNPNFFVYYSRDDKRRYSSDLMPAMGGCTLPFFEMTFDYHGYLRACCYDWNHEIKLGQLGKDDLAILIENYLDFRVKLPHEIWDSAPTKCKICPHKSNNMRILDKKVAERSVQYINAIHE